MATKARTQARTSESKLREAIAQLLKPVARFALTRGFKLQELIECLKAACLHVATEELQAKSQEINTSRLSVLTGLQRKDIRRIKTEDSAPVGSPNLLNRIIGRWQSDPRFLDDDGKPRPLECEGAESEFSDLVAAVSVDTNPYTILFGLEQSGALERIDKRVRLAMPVYDASKNVLDGLQLLAQDSERLHATVSSNLFEKPTVPNLHITTLYDNICVDDLEHIRKWLLEKGSEFHESARVFLARYDKDANPRLYKKQGGATVALSAFSFIDKGGSREKE